MNILVAIAIAVCLAALALLWRAQTVIEVETQSFGVKGVE